MPLQSSVCPNFINSRFHNKSTRWHIRIQSFRRVASNDGHGPGSEPVRREFKFESPFPFIAIAIFQNEFSFFGPWNKTALGRWGSVPVTRLCWIIDPEWIFAGFFVLRFEPGWPTSTLAVVEEIWIVAFLWIVLVILGIKKSNLKNFL